MLDQMILAQQKNHLYSNMLPVHKEALADGCDAMSVTRSLQNPTQNRKYVAQGSGFD